MEENPKQDHGYTSVHAVFQAQCSPGDILEHVFGDVAGLDINAGIGCQEIQRSGNEGGQKDSFH